MPILKKPQIKLSDIESHKFGNGRPASFKPASENKVDEVLPTQAAPFAEIPITSALEPQAKQTEKDDQINPKPQNTSDGIKDDTPQSVSQANLTKQETATNVEKSNLSSLLASDLATMQKASELQELFKQYSFVLENTSPAEGIIYFLRDQILSQVNIDMDVVKSGLQRLALSSQSLASAFPSNDPQESVQQEIKELPQQCPEKDFDILEEMKQLGTTSDSRWGVQDVGEKEASLKNLADKSFASPIKPLQKQAAPNSPQSNKESNKGPITYLKPGLINKHMAQKINKLLPTQAIKGRSNSRTCPPSQRFESTRFQAPSRRKTNVFDDSSSPEANSDSETRYLGKLSFENGDELLEPLHESFV
ncbi:hypothetical protein DSO57_1018087 [Entomophthora muscae]|uniref:Uncharacterized protein n=1 Tax=Entomophthora muscae TaxID=34485 RepID=A0ACC2RVM5_9FUNG|nr:hypothetical protein DSO57_1018087 [Entomophthora muscae]